MKLIPYFLSLPLLAFPLQGSLLFYESFEGSNFVSGSSVSGITSNSAGATGQGGAWAVRSSGATDSIQSSTAMSYSGGSVSNDGGSKYLRLSSTAASQTGEVGVDFNFDLHSTLTTGLNPAGVGSGNSIYWSFLLRRNGAVSNSDIGSAGFVASAISGAGAHQNAAGIGGTSGTTLLNGGSASTGSTAFSDATTYLVVARMQSDGTTWTPLDLWINPTDSSTPGSAEIATVTGTRTSGFLSFSLKVSSLDASESVDFDELRIGQTWSDVIPAVVPEPHSWMLILLCLFFLFPIRSVQILLGKSR